MGELALVKALIEIADRLVNLVKGVKEVDAQSRERFAVYCEKLAARIGAIADETDFQSTASFTNCEALEHHAATFKNVAVGKLSEANTNEIQKLLNEVCANRQVVANLVDAKDGHFARTELARARGIFMATAESLRAY